MKYEAEELYDRLSEEERVGLQQALFFNQIRFKCADIDGIVYKKDGEVHFVYELNETEKADIPLLPQGGEAAQELRDGKSSCFIYDKNENTVNYVFYDDSNSRDDALRYVCIEFLKTAHADTLGRVKALISKGSEMMLTCSKIENFIFSETYDEP